MRVDKADVVRILRQFAELLRPYTDTIEPNTRVWNGQAYVEAPPQDGDRYALAWWSAFTHVADMLDRQAGPLTPEQSKYVKEWLFGGMGSFTDFQVDTRLFGGAADRVNHTLDKKRTEAYRLFT